MKVIGSVQRALNILELFTAQTAELGMTEISEGVKLHKSTAAGLVYTLEANGYLHQNPATRKYKLGFKIAERATIVFEHNDVRQAAAGPLQILRDEVDEAINLAIQDGTEVVYIERLTSSKTLGMRVAIGMRAPIYTSALGKAILAGIPPAAAEAVVKNCDFKPITPNSITDPQKLLKDIELSRQRGFALDDEENELGGRCVSSPIFDHASQVVGAVSISIPISRFPISDVNKFGEKIKETAKNISRGLGYIPRLY